jgi:FAD/FMN-containing dehydrogenase
MVTLSRPVATTVTPADPGYDRARRIWNERFDCRPRAVLYPSNVHEVAAVVRNASDNGIPFRIRSGGHNVEGFSVLDDGYVIDLSRLTGVSVSEDRTAAVISPGVLLGDVYASLWSVGTTIPAGVCPDIRIGGHVLGGGVGMLVRSRGMLVDSLIALSMVDAYGNVLQVDDHTHPDLMWACRGGGGGNFGIATSYTFRIRPIAEVTLVSAEWDFAGAVAALDAWQHWIISADQRVNSRFSIFSRSTGGGLMVALFEGSHAEWESIVAPLLKQHQPVSYAVREVPYIDSVGTFSQRVPSIRAKFVPALSTGPLGTEALRTVERRHRDAPAGVKTGFYAMGGAVLGDDLAQRSAFAHRDALFCVEYLGHWTSPEDDVDHLGWLAGIRDEMRPFMTGGAYVNSPDRDLADWLHAYYGLNLPRLMEVKRRYDPDEVFRFEQSIPASLPESAARSAGLAEPVIADLRGRGLIDS